MSVLRVMHVWYMFISLKPSSYRRQIKHSEPASSALAAAAASRPALMWFWKSSSISGICTVVDMRLQRQTSKTFQPSGWECCESLNLSVPSRTQMFWSDPDVPAGDLGVVRMEELNPDPRFFFWTPKMNEDNSMRMHAGASAAPGLPVCRNMEAARVPPGVCAGLSVCRWDALQNKASSFPVVEIQSHKSVIGRFLTGLRQHRFSLSLPSPHKRPPVSSAGREGWKRKPSGCAEPCSSSPLEDSFIISTQMEALLPPPTRAEENIQRQKRLKRAKRIFSSLQMRQIRHIFTVLTLFKSLGLLR